MYGTMSKPTILVLGTCDTKLEETLYIRQQILRLNACSAQVMDVGRYPSADSGITYEPAQIFSRYHSETQSIPKDLSPISRNEYIEYIAIAAAHYVKSLQSAKQIHGIIAAGGSCGTSISSAVMRDALPVGFPKVLVSTMASSDVRPYIDNVDITMMYSVTYIAGLNFLSRQILSNAAGAISGMVSAQRAFQDQIHSESAAAEESDLPVPRRPRIGVTMFGVTTPGVDAIRARLSKFYGYEVLVFHATGSGGRAMERLCAEGALDGVIDLTTSEIPDELIGGVLTAGPHRLEAPVRAGIPYIVSVGACDMVNFGPENTVPEKWIRADREFYVHNPTVTLMRTTREENRRIGEFIVSKLKGAQKGQEGMIKVLLPVEAISLLAGRGAPFEDRGADEELFTTIEEGLKGTGVEVLRDERGINETGFAERVIQLLVRLMKEQHKKVQE